jgi:hypothetical protein
MKQNYMAPLRVNERRYISVSFSEKATRYEFVCRRKKRGETNLFQVAEMIKAVSDLRMSLDKHLILSQCTQESINDKPYIVLVFKEGDSTDVAEKWVGDDVYLRKAVHQSQSYWSLGSTGEQSHAEVNINIVLWLSDEEAYASHLCFHLIPEDAYFQLALDFGSEASQMYLTQPNEAIPEVNIIEIAKKNLYPEYQDTPDSEFHQYANDKYLFNSIFYVREDQPMFLSKVADDDSLNADSLTDLLPNIKIALLERGYSNKIESDIEKCYRKIVTDFIKTAIAKIQTGRLQTRDIGIQLNLLVPNVMSMKMVMTLISNIFKGILLNGDISSRVHLEIVPYSESDASFAGYCSNEKEDIRKLESDKTYLTIDAGKGTIDFSVISIHSQNNYESLYRDGFIGAGNTITYALFDYICAIIVGSMDAEARQQLMCQILFGPQTDQSGRKKLLESLEHIKLCYNTPDGKERERCDHLFHETNKKKDDLTASGLALILKKEGIQGCLGDQYGIIHATCYNICNLFTRHLFLNKVISRQQEKLQKKSSKNDEKKIPGEMVFDQVILAGRAFKFPMLYREFLNYFTKELLCSPNDIRYDEKYAKSICLYGVMDMLDINYNCGLAGIPSVEGVFASSSAADGKDDLSRKLNSLGDWIKSFVEKKIVDTNSLSTPVNHFRIDEEFLMNGCDFEIDGNSQLRFNGHKMSFRPSSVEAQPYNLYYGDNCLMLRSDQNIQELTISRGELPHENEMLFQCKFPWYTEEDRKNFYMFKPSKA